MLEPMTALAYLAAGTSTIRLGTGICLRAAAQPRVHGQGGGRSSTGCRAAGSTSASASGG